MLNLKLIKNMVSFVTKNTVEELVCVSQVRYIDRILVSLHNIAKIFIEPFQYHGASGSVSGSVLLSVAALMVIWWCCGPATPSSSAEEFQFSHHTACVTVKTLYATRNEEVRGRERGGGGGGGAECVTAKLTSKKVLALAPQHCLSDVADVSAATQQVCCAARVDLHMPQHRKSVSRS